MTRRFIWASLVLVICAPTHSASAERRIAIKSDVYSVAVGDSPFRGPRHAKVTMVMACEFSNVYCKRVAPTIDELIKVYGEQLRVVYKHFRRHRERPSPPELGACAAHQQGKYFEMKSLLWAAYDRKKPFDVLAMRRFAVQIGLDMARFDADATGKCKQIVATDEAALMKVGGKGSPTFYINGRFISGQRPIAHYRVLIDEELTKANKRIKKPSQLSHYYEDYVVKRGKPSAPIDTRPYGICDEAGVKMSHVLLAQAELAAREGKRGELGLVRKRLTAIRMLVNERCEKDKWPEAAKQCFRKLAVSADTPTACFDALPRAARKNLDKGLSSIYEKNQGR